MKLKTKETIQIKNDAHVYYECPKCGDFIDVGKMNATGKFLCTECSLRIDIEEFKPMVIVYKHCER